MRRSMRPRRFSLGMGHTGSVIALFSAMALSAAMADWTNSGGNAGRNGRIEAFGPGAPALLWSGGRPSIIVWQPVIEGERVFMVRQTGFPPGGEPNGSPVVAMNLNTGAELWFKHIPYNSGDWTTWVAGVRNGRVYASRSGNGASVAAKLYCLDAATGNILWSSVDLIKAGPYDGVVFAPNGDPIIADFTHIRRIRASDGTTAWATPRTCSVSGNCGGASTDAAIYIADAVPGGHRIEKYDLSTGAFLYQSPLMSGFTIQNSPMVGPDGTVYLSRTQNNVAVDYFYAFQDTGSALTLKWSVPANWSTSSEFAVGPDGSVYIMSPGYRIARLHPNTGEILNQSDAIPTDNPGGNITPRMASDTMSRLFFSNGQFSGGRFYSFNADLNPPGGRWSVPVPNINIGAPALGGNGVLVIAGVGNDVRAYRTTPCVTDINGDGQTNVVDLLAIVNQWGACPGLPALCTGDIAPTGPPLGDDLVNVLDLLAVVNGWGQCPP